MYDTIETSSTIDNSRYLPDWFNVIRKSYLDAIAMSASTEPVVATEV